MSTSSPSDADIHTILSFLREAGDLKDTLRSGFTNAGASESTAEHTWRLALFVLTLEPYLEGLSVEKLLKMALIHDLGEAVTGDVPAIHQVGDQQQRQDDEREAVDQLTAILPAQVRQALRALAVEYDEGQSPEARFLKGLDKLETIHQHATGTNPKDFDYAFNLAYSATRTRGHPLLEKLRATLDLWTKRRADDPDCDPVAGGEDGQKA